MLTSSDRKAKILSVIRVSGGNFLEMYDFMVFGYYASAIGKAFFPSSSEFASLMLSLMTFGVGFLMRPLGAIVLGAYTDRHGRRAGLILTLGLMSIGIISIACTPGYATIGLLALPCAAVQTHARPAHTSAFPREPRRSSAQCNKPTIGLHRPRCHPLLAAKTWAASWR